MFAKKTVWITGVVGIIFQIAFAFADDPLTPPLPITLNAPSYRGNGCPQGTLSAILSPDQTSLSLLFDNYVTVAGGTSGNKIDAKSCNIMIPINVPSGYSIAIIKSDYRGFLNVPDGADCDMQVNFFFHGHAGNFKHERRWDDRDQRASRHNQDFFLSHEIRENLRSWSKCENKQINLQVDSNLRVRTNRQNEEVYASLDTIDMTASGIVYKIAMKKCPLPQRPPHRPPLGRERR
ncbi:MAG: DUF4360 domain-containing protein [Oligoflexia bacterium]|nr:DUF4360 domain-containing protein [Oligoflexia bacterium]